MRIGLSFDLKETVTPGQNNADDAFEEYDSPKTVELIAKAIQSWGHSVVKLGGGKAFLSHILQEKVDIVFNIAEGRGIYRSREAQVPSVLEMLNIPYTGSDPQCLAICLDKPLTKEIVAAASIPTPKWLVVKDNDELEQISWEGFPFPAIVKPAYEGSSKGIHLSSLTQNPQQTREVASQLLASYQQAVMVEEFIPGDEITVGIIGNAPPQVLGIMRVLPKAKAEHFVYSLETKRDWQTLVAYECPAQLEKEVTERIKIDSLRVFEVLGCRDFARLDFRVSQEGTAYFLEINPLSGLGDYSDLVIMAIKLGWSYEALIGAILDAAVGRYPLCVHR